MPGTFGSRRLLRRLARVAGTVRRSGSVNCVGLGGGKRMEPITASRKPVPGAPSRTAPLFFRGRGVNDGRRAAALVGKLCGPQKRATFSWQKRDYCCCSKRPPVLCVGVFLTVPSTSRPVTIPKGLKKLKKKGTTKGLSRSDGGLRRLLAYVSQAQLRAYLCDELVVV